MSENGEQVRLSFDASREHAEHITKFLDNIGLVRNLSLQPLEEESLDLVEEGVQGPFITEISDSQTGEQIVAVTRSDAQNFARKINLRQQEGLRSFNAIIRGLKSYPFDNPHHSLVRNEEKAKETEKFMVEYETAIPGGSVAKSYALRADHINELVVFIEEKRSIMHGVGETALTMWRGLATEIHPEAETG